MPAATEAPAPFWVPTLEGADLAAVRELAEAVAGEDGVAAFSEPAMLDLAGSGPPTGTRHLLLRAPTGTAAHDPGAHDPGAHDPGAQDTGAPGLAGYAHLDETDPADRVVELAVAPRWRSRGYGTALAAALTQDAADTPTRAWAHGDHAAAARLAERAGLHRARELWMMRREPSAGPLPQRPTPEGVAIVPVRVGVDEPAVVAVNNRAFAWHPEQSGWTVDEVTVLEAQPWFDPAGFLLARDTATGDLLGFHWTKVHERSASVPEPIGEVYVVGVDPAAQGRGLGSLLTLAGLEYLAGRGLGTVVLYVEGDNAAAIATYAKLGFARAAVDVSYAR